LCSRVSPPTSIRRCSTRSKSTGAADDARQEACRPRARRAKQPAKPDPAPARELAATRKQLERAQARIAELEAEPQPSAPPAEVAAIAAKVPTDPLEAMHAAHRLLLETMFDAARDPDITPAERRKELRTIAAAAVKLVPDSRRWESDQLIKEDRHILEKKAAERRGAKLERLRR
jgi:hypothetical protein